MAQNLVIYVQGGQVRRIMADFEASMNCLLVYADVPTADQGQPWVREIEWPSRNGQEVLLEGMAVEHSPEEVRAVVKATEETRARVRELFRDADSSSLAGPNHDGTMPRNRGSRLSIQEIAMSQLELNDQEKETLLEVLRSFLSELRNEVSHTDRLAYRNQLKAQEHVIQGILGRLSSLGQTTR